MSESIDICERNTTESWQIRRLPCVERMHRALSRRPLLRRHFTLPSCWRGSRSSYVSVKWLQGV